MPLAESLFCHHRGWDVSYRVTGRDSTKPISRPPPAAVSG
jgi:hypothetical protein